MYVASTRSGRPGASSTLRTAVPRTVVLLGTVSLLTDVSSEMVTAFLPVYLVFTLNMSYLQVGMLDAVYTGATSVLRMVGGYLSDKIGRHKAVAVAGYGLSAVTKLAFPAVGASAAGLSGVLAVDRAGKGLRTAPRDAMISLVTTKEKLGRSFGVHRMMDTIGALLGPLATYLVLTSLGTKPGPIFMISFCFAMLGLIVLVCFVRQPPKAEAVPSASRVSVKRSLALLREPGIARTSLAALMLGLVSIADVFVYLVLQSTTGVDPRLLPLMPLGTALVFLLAATPLGQLADKVGRWKVFFAGHVVLLGVYLLLLGPFGGLPLAACTLLLHGLFYAATDGVLMAHGATLVAPELRASGLAIVQTAQAVGRFTSSLLFGLLMTQLSMASAVLVAVVALAATLITVSALIRPAAGA
ncbi:MFS transporter [Labedaea rhizosphaerae]|uniref:Putative MFS family arabinose efflux permease n=1 Tax=Labedaea rhizosphaerae TaxID=598644 RepID=A0A4R6SNB6_LABRH|nr:MFS transporter [Labedaea rhizosphaerae]TDQ05527.1 putative MFS family arabinose efflux permease [Labedaea rhizosphaerae]